MASSNLFSMLLVLFALVGVGMAQDFDETIRANDCDSKLGHTCSLEVLAGIYQNGNITKKCCGELLVFGKVCHEAELKRVLEFPGYKRNDPAAILAKGELVWDQCQAIVNGSVSQPTS